MAEEFPHYIEFRHVYKTFDKPVLIDSNFHVDAGQTVAIIGRSGVGKSVTLGAHHGFPEARQGPGDRRQRRCHGLFRSGNESHPPQSHNGFPVRRALRFPDSGGEHLLLARTPARTTMPRTKTTWSPGFSKWSVSGTSRDAYPGDLSTGYRRAIAIARALAAQPQCVLYDEPTTMVDPIMSDQLTVLMMRLKKELQADVRRSDARSGPAEPRSR